MRVFFTKRNHLEIGGENSRYLIKYQIFAYLKH